MEPAVGFAAKLLEQLESIPRPGAKPAHWFPRFDQFPRDPDGLGQYLGEEFERHCHRLYKKRLAK